MTSASLIKKILEEYKNVIHELYKNRLISEHREVSVKCVGKEKYNLTWDGRNASANITYKNEVNGYKVAEELLEKEQFSILFYDRGIIQVEYNIENGEIIKQRLQFVRRNNKYMSLKDINELEMMDSEVESYWFEEECGFPIILRVDYDPYNYKELIHPKSHLTMFNVEECRIPLDGNYPFSEFVKMILMQFYGTDDIAFNKHLASTRLLKDNERIDMYIDWNYNRR